MTKKITIETLADMVQKGFTESDARTDKKIDGLARMVQEGFKQTASKNDINLVREELHETREILAKAIKDLEVHFSASLSHAREEIDHLRNWMEGIEARVASLEKQKHKK